MSGTYADRARQFVCDFWYERPDKLQSVTRLEEDFGITGSDAADFLEAFSKELEVDLTGLEFHKHFGPECSGPIRFWPSGLKEEMKDLGNDPVTVGHLIEVAVAERWFCPPRRGEKKWLPLPSVGLWDQELDG